MSEEIKKYKLYYLQKKYNNIISIINNLEDHLNELSNIHLINNIMEYSNKIYEIIKNLNAYYNSLINYYFENNMTDIDTLINSLNASDKLLKQVLIKSSFWSKNAAINLNERQRKVVNKLLDGFEGKLTSDKWSKLTNCSKDTAIRDINDLITKELIQKEAAGGRSTSYVLKMEY